MRRSRKLIVCASALTGAFLLGLATRPELSSGEKPASELAPPATRTESPLPVPEVSERVAAPLMDLGRSAAEEEVPDPVEQVRLGAHVGDVFESEPRDPAWAPQVERFLRAELSEYLKVFVPEAEEIQAECRRSSCRVSFTVPAENEDAFVIQQVLPLGPLQQPWSETLDDRPDRVRMGMTVLYDRDWRSLDRMPSKYRNELARRFPEGYEVAKAYLDKHGLAGQPREEAP